MLWVDKYRPASLDKMDYHKDLSEQLKRMASSGDFAHLMVYGPSGAGKKTRIMAILREIYGAGVLRMKIENRTFKTPSKQSFEVNNIASNFHIEINPSEVGIHDRLVVQELLKEIASSHTLGEFPFKVVVLTEVDKLTKDAQHALRRTMEKYTATCRLILCCQSTCRVIEPIRSRCLGVRVGAPEPPDIVNILQSIAKKESIVLPGELAERISRASGRNLRRAILMLEACRMQKYPLTPDQAIPLADWETFLGELVRLILENQDAPTLLKARNMMYELLSHCIPPELILKQMCTELLRKTDAELKYDVIKWAAFYEHRITTGRKPIVHLEAFVAIFMSVYKKYLVYMFE